MGILLRHIRLSMSKGEALWPERWDLESLDARRNDMPAIAFAREYLCEPMDDVSAVSSRQPFSKPLKTHH